MLNRGPRLMWNADETQINTAKRFRVLCERKKKPLLTSENKLPHLTASMSISASGHLLRPLIILPNLQNLKTLALLQWHCELATSSNGRITKDLWVYFALFFASQVTAYRTTLTENLRTQEMLLIADGHRARLSWAAAAILKRFNIALPVLPAHSSHLPQHFDVSAASPLKAAFKAEPEKRIYRLPEAEPGKRQKTAILRQIMVGSFLDAMRKAETIGNIKAGFAAAGIAPLIYPVGRTSPRTQSLSVCAVRPLARQRRTANA